MEHTLVEANDLFRIHRVPNLGRYFPYPVCSAGAFKLEDEARDVGGDGVESVHSVIDRERDCPEWTLWLMGSSPKEHRDMLMAKEEREFQSALARIHRCGAALGLEQGVRAS